MGAEQGDGRGSLLWREDLRGEHRDRHEHRRGEDGGMHNLPQQQHHSSSVQCHACRPLYAGHWSGALDQSIGSRASNAKGIPYTSTRLNDVSLKIFRVLNENVKPIIPAPILLEKISLQWMSQIIFDREYREKYIRATQIEYTLVNSNDTLNQAPTYVPTMVPKPNGGNPPSPHKVSLTTHSPRSKLNKKFLILIRSTSWRTT